MNKLTEEEMSNIEFKVSRILNQIISSNDSLEVKVISAFQEGLKHAKEIMIETKTTLFTNNKK